MKFVLSTEFISSIYLRMKFWEAYDSTASILSEKTKGLCKEPITHGHLLNADRSVYLVQRRPPSKPFKIIFRYSVIVSDSLSTRPDTLNLKITTQ